MLAERLWLISGYPENGYKNLKFSILETFILNVEQHQEAEMKPRSVLRHCLPW